MYAEEIVGHTVFIHQFVERLACLLLVLCLVLRSEHLGHRKKVQDAHHEGHQTNREEGEERERLVAGTLESVADDKVGRRTDEGHHAAHAAGEGQRHEQAARRGACRSGHADYDRQHQGHRACVADEHSYSRCHYHHEKEKTDLAVACKGHHLAAYHLSQTCLEYAASDYEQSDHHYDRRVGEAREAFSRCEDLAEQQRQKGADGHEVRPHLAADKEYGRNQ